MDSRLDKQMQFILEIDKIKKITRQTYLADASRKENDAEHSWHLAMMCLLLSEHSNEDIDVLHTMSMVLIHDIIEIDAGDTYAYDDAGNATKRERECRAADRLFNILPDDQAKMLRDLWEEFEACETPESHFANSLDHIQPVMLNDASGGKAWSEHGVCLSKILKRNKNTSLGSDNLWNYALYRNIKPNVLKGNVIDDYDGVVHSRYELSMARIKEISSDEMKMPVKYRDYFVSMSEVFSDYYECIGWISANCVKFAAPSTSWYKEFSLEKWQEMSYKVNRHRYENKMYNNSYANPEYTAKIDNKLGGMLSYLASEICSLGVYCFEERYFDITICAELFLEIYNIFESEPESALEGLIKSSIYYFVYDYMDDLYESRVRESLSPDYKFFKDILTKTDIMDDRSIYLYGENIGINELETYRYLRNLPESMITSLATAFTEGYRRSFEASGIDLSKKQTVQIRYPIGFERIMKTAVEQFKKIGLEPVIFRKAVNRRRLFPEATGCIDCNNQFAYDHRYDKAIYFNKAVKDRQLASLKNAYEKYSSDAKVYAGPAVVEFFGEKPFIPVDKSEAFSLDDIARKLDVEYSIEAGNLVNNYISRDNYSYTIIAFPLPEIGNDYDSIFKATADINTLDPEMYKNIQQRIIDTLDACDHVLIKGCGENRTDLRISLKDITDSNSQTRFENCLADCNIPVGEVFTSPVLKGTTGILNVTQVYINGLEYKNLYIEFKDGMTGDYNCSNTGNSVADKSFVRDNLMRQHETLPMGEFAIGTNTAAYAMGKKYEISSRLPILIAEKTGPHIAIGDTCYSMSEELKVYNPDGKEIIAKENEISFNRHTDVSKAYFSCHTDITIPYNELALITAVNTDGTQSDIIKDGRFVLEGTQPLNDALKLI